MGDLMYFPMVVEPLEGVVGAAAGPEGPDDDNRQMPMEPACFWDQNAPKKSQRKLEL